MASGNALVLVPILWATVLVGWSPLLLSARVRWLFERWPTSYLPVNYGVLVGGLVTVHALLFLGLSLLPKPPHWHVLHYAAITALGVPAAAWAGVVVGVPRLTDADLPEGTWLPLAVGAVWYAVVVGVVAAVLALVLFVLYYPG